MKKIKKVASSVTETYFHMRSLDALGLFLVPFQFQFTSSMPCPSQLRVLLAIQIAFLVHEEYVSSFSRFCEEYFHLKLKNGKNVMLKNGLSSSMLLYCMHGKTCLMPIELWFMIKISHFPVQSPIFIATK